MRLVKNPAFPVRQENQQTMVFIVSSVQAGISQMRPLVLTAQGAISLPRIRMEIAVPAKQVHLTKTQPGHNVNRVPQATFKDVLLEPIAANVLLGLLHIKSKQSAKPAQRDITGRIKKWNLVHSVSKGNIALPSHKSPAKSVKKESIQKKRAQVHALDVLLVVTWMNMDGATAKLVPKGIHRVDKIRVGVKNAPKVALRLTKAWLHAIFANQANIRITRRVEIAKYAILEKHNRGMVLKTAISVP